MCVTNDDDLAVRTGAALDIAALAAAMIGALTVAFGHSSLSAPESYTAAGALAVLLAPLFVPVSPRAGAPLRLIACAAAAALLVVSAGFLLAPRAIPVAGVAAVGAVTFAIVLASSAALLLLSRSNLVRGRAAALEAGRFALVGTIAFAGSAPLWLGPVASGSPGREAIADTLLAASPLIHLAVAAGADLLRSPWFYEHTSVGSLRFSYPQPWLATLVYLMVAAALCIPALRYRQESHA